MSKKPEDATARPWLIRTLENFGFNVVHYNAGDKFDIVRVAKCSDEANARLIVTAVNSYEPMLAALEGLEGILATAESNASGNPEWLYISGKINAAREAIDIAKLEGEKP